MLLDEDLEEYLGNVESALKETLKKLETFPHHKNILKMMLSIVIFPGNTEEGSHHETNQLTNKLLQQAVLCGEILVD